jgi:hypothetical protein
VNMGWLWSSSTTLPPSTPSSQEPEASSTPQSLPHKPSSRDHATEENHKQLLRPEQDVKEAMTVAREEQKELLRRHEERTKSASRDEIADEELQSFLRELVAEESTPKPPKFVRKPKSINPTSSATPNQLLSNEPLSEQLLPTIMSCRTAFDQAFYCNSLGGRFNDLYRYGNIRSCSEDWNDFWFCMRTRGYTGKSKEDAIREHYRQKERVKYAKDLGKESSENVWRTREVMVERGEVMNKPFPTEAVGNGGSMGS